jgi:5-methylcytosine-specific restriction enzyme B
MADEMDFTVGGAVVRISRRAFEARLAGVVPESVRKYVVEIAGTRYPVKQAVSIGLGLPRASFQSQEAYRILRKLGFHPEE